VRQEASAITEASEAGVAMGALMSVMDAMEPPVGTEPIEAVFCAKTGATLRRMAKVYFILTGLKASRVGKVERVEANE
jgi:hypothetical protein